MVPTFSPHRARTILWGSFSAKTSTGMWLSMDRDVAVKNWDLDQNILDAIPSDSRGCQVAYHITVCKLRYGNTFGVFGELGFGFKGILNIGLSIDL